MKYIFYLLNLFLPNIIVSLISIPFHKKILDFNNDYFFQNNILVEMEIGNPKVNINLIIDFLGRFIYIPDHTIGGIYSNKSKTYNFVEKCLIPFSYHHFYFNFYYAKENFYNKNNTFESFNFNFLYESSNNGTMENGILGFEKPTFNDSKNFKYLLKESNFIDQYIYKIKFLNENSGEIYIGSNSSEISDNFISIPIEYIYNIMYLKFDKIIYDNITENEPQIIIDYNLRGISVNKNYYNYIYELFFSSLINNKKCDLKYNNNTDNKYIYFVCDKDIDIKNFKSLNIIIKKMNYSFVLNNSDLFQDYQNKKYCLIFHDLMYPLKWRFGQVFFQKYEFSINEDSKNAFYYIINNQTKDNTKDNKDYFFKILLIIFFLIIIILTIIIIYMIKNKPRKKRANELEDDNYEYKSKKTLI